MLIMLSEPLVDVQSATEEINVDDTQNEPENIDGEEVQPQTPTSNFTPQRPKMRSRTYKQQLDVEAKKLVISKLEAEIEAAKKYSQAQESAHQANLKTQQAQELVR